MTTKHRAAVVGVRVTLLMCTHQEAISKDRQTNNASGVTEPPQGKLPTMV
jgi:hypothetical protein